YFWRPTRGDDGRPFYAWFIKRYPYTGVRTHHIHMVEAGEQFAVHWERLLFRDYLIANPNVAKEYELLKLRLAAESSRNRVTYTQAKTSFIERVMTELKNAASS
ncbi:MAG TPA: GrpB family protein, partial [Gammaproteobacteria bacterium]